MSSLAVNTAKEHASVPSSTSHIVTETSAAASASGFALDNTQHGMTLSSLTASLQSNVTGPSSASSVLHPVDCNFSAGLRSLATGVIGAAHVNGSGFLVGAAEPPAASLAFGEQFSPSGSKNASALEVSTDSTRRAAASFSTDKGVSASLPSSGNAGTAAFASSEAFSAPLQPKAASTNSASASTSREFTCVILTDWLVHSDLGASPKSEILEFSWAVYDIHSECLLEKVRHIVRPTETPGTNISESLLKTLKLNDCRPLERAKSLKQVLTEFDSACSMVSVPSVCVVAGSIKLRDHLLAETFRKGVPVPKCLRSVVDLATLAAHFYPMQFSGVTQDILSPRDIAKHLSASIPSQEEEFSSMDGCMTMCQIVKKMHLDNIHFQPQHLSTVVTAPSAALPEPVAEISTAARQSPITDTPFSPTSSQLKDCVIRMRGVPWGITETDVVKFIDPVCTVSPSDVHIVTNFEGKASGEVFVRVRTMADRDKCLQELHGRYLGPRWIEVFKASLNDFYHFPAFRDMEPIDKRGALRLRGLPWSTNEYEIVKFFADGGFRVDINSVALGQSHDSRFNGDAWVLLESAQLADEARRVLHKKMIGRRYIELFPSTPREVDIARRGPIPALGRGGFERHGPYTMGPGLSHSGTASGVWNSGRPDARGPRGFSGPAACSLPAPSVMACPTRLHGLNNSVPFSHTGAQKLGPPSDCRPSDVLSRHSAQASGWGSAVVRLRGLPYHVNENHIVEFFHGYAMAAILPATAPINGRPSGEAYVEFASPEEAWRALKSRNGALMDRRYIELFPATKQEMELAAAGMDPREIRSRCPRP